MAIQEEEEIWEMKKKFPRERDYLKSRNVNDFRHGAITLGLTLTSNMKYGKVLGILCNCNRLVLKTGRERKTFLGTILGSDFGKRFIGGFGTIFGVILGKAYEKRSVNFWEHF